jgi:hypothetical protein
MTVTVRAYVWNEHEEPQEIPWGKEDDLLSSMISQRLQTKEYGKIVRSWPADERHPRRLPAGELELYYRAFTDPYRGRIIVSGADLADLDANYQQTRKYCAQKVFSPAELYALKPVDTDYGSWHTISTHFQEDNFSYFDVDTDAVAQTQRMETRTLVNHDYDGRRGWTLQTVWFDGKPVMVVTSSGRDGSEYTERWITDPEQFGKLLAFLKSFAPEPEGLSGFVKADTKIPAMTEFYGHTIHDYYDVEAQEPKKR